MRKVLQSSKNGVAVQEIVTLESLTAKELDMLTIPSGSKIEDYVTFQVRHNKQGELLGVQVHDFIEAKAKQIEEDMSKPTILDYLTAFEKSTTKISKHRRLVAQAKF